MFELNKYLMNLPSGFDAKSSFREWLLEEAGPPGMRRIVQYVEQQVKEVAGAYPDISLPMVDASTWDRLRVLIEIRQMVLDELMIPTEEEVMRVGKLNDRLLGLTQQLYAKTFDLWKAMNDSGLELGDDYCAEGTIKYRWEEDRPVLTFDNDSRYGSDFNYMLWFLSEFDQRDSHTMKSIHEILQNFGVTEEEARKALVDTFDDDDTWTDGALLKPAFKDVTVCYVLYALCCHFHYSLADVLRMDSFTVMAHAEYNHESLMSGITR